MVRIIVISAIGSESNVVKKLKRVLSKKGSFSFAIVLKKPNEKLDEEWPLPTYIVGDNDQHAKNYEKQKIHFLAGHGIKDIDGLRVAFATNCEDTGKLTDMLRSKSDKGVDVLVAPNSGKDSNENKASENVLRAALPRYHFFAAAEFKEHEVVQLNGADYGSRRIGIGRTGRWLYAADIKGLKEMGNDERKATVPKTLASARKRGRTEGNEGAAKRKKDVCWFCLENKIAQHLVLVQGEHAYIAVAKGGVHEGHLLIVPKAHVRGCGSDAVDDRCIAEMRAMKDGIRRYFEKEKNCETMFYEWCGQSDRLHMVIQAVAIRREVCARVANVLVEMGEKFKAGVKLEDGDDGMEEIRQRNLEYYFSTELPGQKRAIIVLNDEVKLPANFGRLVVTKSLGVPQRADWRKCVKDEAVERSIAGRICDEIEEYVRHVVKL